MSLPPKLTSLVIRGSAKRQHASGVRREALCRARTCCDARCRALAVNGETQGTCGQYTQRRTAGATSSPVIQATVSSACHTERDCKAAAPGECERRLKSAIKVVLEAFCISCQFAWRSSAISARTSLKMIHEDEVGALGALEGKLLDLHAFSRPDSQ